MNRKHLIIAAAALLSWPALHSVEQGPFPDISLTDRRGEVLSSREVLPAGRALLVYVTPGSPAGESLTELLPGWVPPEKVDRVLLVMGADLPDARQAWEGSPDLDRFPWFADPGRAAWKALSLSGSPTLIGVEDGRIHWILGGVLNDPAVMSSVLRSWIGLGPADGAGAGTPAE